MPLNWKEFSGADAFKSLKPEEQDAARLRFFDDQVAPRFAPEKRDGALAEFNRRTMTPATVAKPAVAPASIQRPEANVAARAEVPAPQQAAMPVRPVRPGQVQPAAAQPVIPRPPAGGAGFVEGLKDFGRGIARGVTEEIPAAVAGLVDYADTPTFDAAGKMAGDTGASDWARSTEEAAKARGENWQESEYGRQMRERDAFSVRGAAGEAGRMLPLSFGGGLAGAATGAAVGSVVPGLGTAAGAAAGYLAGSIASLPLFFGRQAKDTYDRVLEQTKLDNPDLTDEDAHDKAMVAGGLTGAVEAGGELVADLVGAKVFKLLPSGAKQGLVRAATKSFQGVRPMIADMLKIVSTEVGTELAQGTAQASIEKGYGVGEGATWENQKGVIMPTVLMSLVGGGAAVGMSARERYRTSKLLANPSFTPQQRLGAAQNVARALHQQDPELAKLFFGEAQRQIAAGKPVIAEDDKFYRDLKPLSQREEDQRLAAGEDMPSEEARTAAFGEADVPRGTEIPPEAFAQPEGAEATDTLATDENGDILIEDGGEPVATTGVPPATPDAVPGVAPPTEQPADAAPPTEQPITAAAAAAPPAETPTDAPLAPEARKQHMTAIGANLKVLRAEREAAKQAGNEALMAEVDDEIQATAVNFKRLANNQAPLPTPREQAATPAQPVEVAPAEPAAALPKNDGIDLADEQPVKALDDERMQDPDFRNWMESAVGGLVSVKDGNLGLAVDPNFIKGESDRGDEVRMIRSGSVNPPWFQEIAAAENVSVEGLRGIVKKAMTGAKLGVRQDRAVRRLMDAITDERIGELQDWGRGLGMSAEEVAGLHNDNPVAHMRALEAEVSARQKKAADAEVEQQWAEQDAVVAGKKPFTPDVVLGEDAGDLEGVDFSDQEKIESHVYATAAGWGVPIAQLDELHAQAPDAESFLSSVRTAIREIRANEKIRSDQGEAGSLADIGGQGTPESGESATAEAERLAAIEQARAEAIPALEEYLGTDWRKDGERRARLAAASPDELVEEVYRDKMTGLLNKRAWNEDVVKAGFEKEGRRSKPSAIAYIDLDGLKFLNDEMGHAAGDELLANFGAAMKAAGIDGYHISGDEFGAIFENEADASEAMDRLQREVESSVVRGKSKDGRGITNTGIAFSYGLGGSANSADMAMQDNKKAREAQGLRTRGGMPSTAAYDEESVLQPYDQAAIDAKAAEDKARAKKDADAAAKQKADDERGDFVLAGSARPADQAAARGAQDMFSGGGEAPAAPKAKPSANTVFTEDAAAAARERLRAKFGRPQTGLDPESVMDGITLAGYHIERGARTFSAYAKAMLADLGDAVRPYLKSWYVAISLDPRAAAFDGMDSYDAVKAVDVDAITSGPEADPINTAAHEAATSPQNDLPPPSEAQKDAGNYQKGHVTWNGLDITIENPAGSKRRPEWPTLQAHYGYLKRTEGADGEHVDVFINPDEARADTVFVIDQLKGGKAGAGFDEHKVMLGFKDKAAAVAAYKANYTRGWQVGPVTEMSVDEFKAWLKDGDSTKPAADAPAKAGGPSYKPGQIIRANIDGKPEYVIVRNEWTDAERSRGEPISVRTQAMVARVVEIQESDVLHAGRTPEWAAEIEAIAAELEAIGKPLHATTIRKNLAGSEFPADINLQVAKDTLQKFKNPPPAPADEHAGKWFGSKDKALQYLAKKKIGATHTIAQSGTRFEIQPIAPASAQAYAGETPATENNDAKRPVDQPGAGALAGKPAAAVRPAEEVGGTGSGAAGSGSGNAGGTGNAAGAGAGLASSVGNGAGTVPVPASGAASLGAGAAELDLFGVRGPAATEAAAGPGGRGDAPGLVAPAQLSPDFVITDDVDLGGGGEKTKYRRNVDAIRLLNTLESEGRYATADEQRTLALYVGWGGLQGAFDPNNEKWAKEYAELKDLMTPEEYAEAAQSTQYAHYTSKEIIGGIYGALERMGFTGGKVLEAGGGVGNFIGLMPDAMRTAGRFTLVERERIAAGIAKHLYPQQNVQKADFAAFGRGADGQYDVAAGNPPFSRTALSDQSGRKHLSGLRIHNYFIAKEIDLLRPGGILANVVSNGFLDSADSRARDYIASRAKFLGAIRLPNNAFSKNAGTEVTTDIVFFQKLPESEWGSRAAKKDAERWTTLGRMSSANGGEKIPTNIYFVNNPQMMLGNWGRFGSMYRADQPALVAKPGQNTALDLAARLLDLPANIYQPAAVTGTQNIVDAAVVALNNPTVSEGGFYLQDGKLFERLPDNAGQAYGRALTPVSKWTEKTVLGKSGHDRLVALVNLRGTLRSLLAAEMADDQKVMDRLRAQLNAQYDAYAKDVLLNDPGTTRYFGDDPDYPLLASLELDYKPGVGDAAAKKAGIKPFKSSAKKAAIFTRRVVDHRKPVSKADSPQDALNISLAERGVIDADYIGKLLDKDPQSVLEELASGESPLLFMDPATNEYVLRDEYLSGNVRRKLAQARQSGMMANARALEQVQPEDVGAGEISARIGSPWVPPTIYADFAKSILGEGTKASLQYVPFDSSFTGYIEAGSRVADTSTYGTKDYEASRLIYSMLNNREIKVTYTDSDGKTHTDKEGTELARDKAQEIREKFQDWLFADSDRAEVLVRAYNDANNNYVTRVFDGSWLTFPGKVPDEIIKFRRHQRNFVARVMQTRTALADHVVGAGKTYSAIAAAMELKRTGLAKKPMIVVPNHLVKQWATDFYRLYPGANILTATKKDFERVNRRRFLGKIATGDWDAVIIAHSSFNFIKPDPAFEEEFTKAEVKELMDLIAQIEKADDSKENKRKVKQLQSQQERLENKLKSLREKPVDDMLDFEQLGVDQLFVDEAHLFKNLMFSTKMQNIRGLGDAKGSQRAFDMFIKVNETFQKNGRGQGVVFLTGTPVSNSLAEMYHMMRYLMPEQMREAKFWPFDAWANTYASIEETLKPKTSGNGYKTVTAFGAFTNTFELLKMFDQVSDTVTMDDIKSAYSEENGGAEFPLPKVKTGRRQPVAMEMSEAQSAYMEEIAKRAEALEQRKGPPQKGEDNHLKVMGDARKAALDVRLVDTTVTEREKGARLDRAAGEIHARYQQFDAERGTQLVFSDLGTPIKSAKKELEKYQALQERINRAADPKVQQDAALGDDAAIDIMNDAEEAQAEIDEQGSDWLDGIKAALRGFSVYDDLKAALIERGIPEAQIAFIHDFNTDDQKAGLFRKVKDGTIRVLMGSTPKLGAGTNVQDRLVALHHIDIPWKPSDVEQREGRIVRQGNLLSMPKLADGTPNPDYIDGFEVEILAYVTKDTLDKNMWDIQERKLRGINQLRSRQISREIENSFDEMEMSASEMQAAATGNVDLLREIQLRNDIQKLERKKRGFDAQRADRDNRRKRAQQLIATLPADIALAEKADAYAKEYRDSLQKMQDEFAVTIDGTEYTDWKKAGLYLREQVDKTVTDESGKEKPAPLNVTINGEKYTNRTKMTEAFTELRGDADPVIWEIDGATLRRRNAIEKAIRQRVADALAEQTEQSIGRIGKYDVTIEGDGLEAVNVTMKAPGGIETGMKLSVPKVDPEDAARIAGTSIVRAADNHAIASGEAAWRKNLLKNAQRDLTELGEAGAKAAWPDMAKLEAARAEHKEILSRLKASDEAKKAAREADAPAPDAAPQFSRSPAAKPGHTEATLYEQLRGLFGPKFMDRLFQSGRFRIITTKEAASILGMADSDALRSGGAVRGFYHRGNGITYLVADSIPKRFTDAQLKGLMRHEIGVHALKAGRDSAGWQNILGEIDRLIDSGDKAVHAAFLRAGAAGTRDVDLLEEVAGYLVEDAPDSSIARQIIAWFKNQIYKLTGFQMKLTDADIVAMAKAALRSAPRDLAGEFAGRGLAMFSRASPVNSEAFRRWFGDSKVVDENGAPKVVYHGTGQNFSAFDPEADPRAWESDRGLFFFTSSRKGASDYASIAAMEATGYKGGAPGANVMPVYLSIRNPLIEETSGDPDARWDESGQALAWAAKELKHDGVIIRNAESGQSLYVAFKPTQIKSAIGNRGTFDSGNPDILFSRAQNPVQGALVPPAQPPQGETSEAYQAIRDRVLAEPDALQPLPKRITGWLKDHWEILQDEWRQGMVDSFDRIAKLETLRHGKLLDASESAYKAATHTRNLSSVIGVIMERGAIKLENGSIALDGDSKGFLSIFEPLKARGLMQDWELWAAAKRAKLLMEEDAAANTVGARDLAVWTPILNQLNRTEPANYTGGARKWHADVREAKENIDSAKKMIAQKRERLMTPDMVDSVLSEIAGNASLRDLFNEVHRDWRQFNKAMLDFAESSGLIDAGERRLWERDEYVPFHRVSLGEGEQKGGKRKRSLSGQKSGIVRLKGGVEKLGIVEAMVRNMAHLVDASLKNLAMQRVVDLTKDFDVDGSPVLEKIASSNLTLDEIRAKLDELDIDHAGRDDKWLMAWRGPLARAEAGHGTVTVMRGGKQERYMVHDRMLLDSITNMGAPAVEGVMKLFSFSKRLLTDMVTAEPAFAIANFLRDSISTAVTVHGKDSGFSITPIVDGIRGANEALKKNDKYWTVMASGAVGGNFYDTSPDDVRRHLSNLYTSAGVLNSLHRGWQWYQDKLQASELGNRLAVFDAYKSAGASDAEAAYQAGDVLQFSRRGSWKAMQILTTAVPFLNARIQGLDRLGRGAQANPKAFALKGAILMAATLAILASNWDDDDYWDLKEHDRDTYYHLMAASWTDKNGKRQWIRIPKPFEVGAFFSTIPERIFEQMRSDADTKLLGQRMLQMIADTFAMNPVPQLVKPLAEMASNMNWFTGAPIVSEGMEYVRPEQQYTPYTSDTMKAMAEAMPDSAPEWMRSPVRLESVMRGYLGSLGGYALMASDYVVREMLDEPNRPEMRPQDYPVVKRFVRGEGATKHVDRAYEIAREADQLFMGISKLQKEGRREDALRMHRENIDKLRVRAAVNRQIAEMSRVSAQIRRVYDSKGMTDEQKRKTVDMLAERRNYVAENVSKRYWATFR